MSEVLTMLYTLDIPVSTSHGHIYHALSMKSKHFHHCDHDEYVHTYLDVDPLSHSAWTSIQATTSWYSRAMKSKTLYSSLFPIDAEAAEYSVTLQLLRS